MGIILFNLAGLLALSGMFGAYMGFNNSVIDPLTIKSWDEFVMLRELMVEWDKYTYYLGWGMFATMIFVLIVDLLYCIRKL